MKRIQESDNSVKYEFTDGFDENFSTITFVESIETKELEIFTSGIKTPEENLLDEFFLDPLRKQLNLVDKKLSFQGKSLYYKDIICSYFESCDASICSIYIYINARETLTIGIRYIYGPLEPTMEESIKETLKVIKDETYIDYLGRIVNSVINDMESYQLKTDKKIKFLEKRIIELESKIDSEIKDIKYNIMFRP